MHATSVTSTSISLAWTPPNSESSSASTSTPTSAVPADVLTGDELTAAAGVVAGDVATDAETLTAKQLQQSPDSTSDANADDIGFVVQYGRVNNMTMYETIAKLENVSKLSIDAYCIN